MSASSSTSSNEKVMNAAQDEIPTTTESLIDTSLPARYAKTMKRHSRLNRANDPSLSSRVLLLGFLGLLFYYAIQSKLKVRIWRISLNPVEYDKDYTGLIEIE